MIEIKCDICGEMHKPYGRPGEGGSTPLDRANSIAFTHMSSHLRVTMAEYDVCPDCKRRIINFIEDIRVSSSDVRRCTFLSRE